MSTLNEKTEKTGKVIHLLVTTLCKRNCKYCCNKQYDMNDIPYVTDDELKDAETLCLTGGEPFLFANPCEIAMHYRQRYKNIRNVYVYTNAYELAMYLRNGGKIYAIDGVNVSIKTKLDADAFRDMLSVDAVIPMLKGNRLYVFDNLFTEDVPGFDVFQREWQEDFAPANDSIFRKA